MIVRSKITPLFGARKMATKKPRTVFFGSGPVALKSLQRLSTHTDIEAIITKPATEGVMKAAFSDVPVFTASRRAEIDTVCRNQHFTSSFGVLIDFGAIVDQSAIDSFPLGIIN